MIYYIKEDFIKEYLKRFQVQLILFLNHLFKNVEIRYWSTKFKIVDIM